MNSNVRFVLSLLSEGFTLSEVQKELNITSKEFNSILKTIRDLGYDYTKSFSDDGNTYIKISRRLNFNPKEHQAINVTGSTFHTLLISDTHIGGPFEQPKRLEIISEYAKEHNIHTVFNAGDLINNYYPDQEPVLKYQTPEEQIRRYLKYLPLNDQIIYYNLGGNHDYKSLIDKGFDPLRYLSDRRIDQVSLGYGLCYIHLKGDTIALAHDLKNTNNNINSTIIFRGHSHKYKNRDNKIIYVPALTDNYQGQYEYIPLPGFLDVELHFFDNKITSMNLRKLAFIGTDIRLSTEERMIIRPDYQERYIKKLQKKKK